MNIYKPTWLYIKQHNQTGLKYFGMTRNKYVNSYPGSGKYWKLHLAKHGNDVTTTWAKLYFDETELLAYAAIFSIENNIVESTEWANLVVESGIYGQSARKGWKHTDEARQKISESGKGKPGRKTMLGKHHSEESKIKCSKSLAGRKRPTVTSRAKEWKITNLVTSEIIVVTNFCSWCRSNGINYGSAHRTIKEGRPYKNFQVEEILVIE
jgi:hypothetical protein